MTKTVFWQCLFYALAFYITWPILFSVYLASVDLNGPLGLTLTVAFVAPLQGFNNFLVYIRPRFFHKVATPSQRQLEQEESSTEKTSFSQRIRISSLRFGQPVERRQQSNVHVYLDPSVLIASENDTAKDQVEQRERSGCDFPQKDKSVRFTVGETPLSEVSQEMPDADPERENAGKGSRSKTNLSMPMPSPAELE